MNSQPVKYVVGRGYSLSGTGLFGHNDRLSMYPTKKAATEFAKRFGWSAQNVVTVFYPLFAGYAVAQHQGEMIRFLADDGGWVDAPFQG